MTPPEPRNSPSTVYYNMKTARPQPPNSKSYSAHPNSYSSSVAHARTLSSSHSRSTTKTSSPMASPRGPLSVGQPFPPKHSPAATSRQNLSTPPVGQIGSQTQRTPSPNYFGLQVEASVDANETGAIPRGSRSPSTSSIKSFGAAMPQQQHLPHDTNPEFEAFRRQADALRGKSSFSLGSSHFGVGTPFAQGASALARPQPPRWHTTGSEVTIQAPFSSSGSQPAQAVQTKGAPTEKMELDADAHSMHDSAYVSSDSKRSSETSLDHQPTTILNMPRYESPVQFEHLSDKRTSLSKVDDRHPRLSMIQGKADPPSPDPERFPKGRSDTVPVTLDHGAPGMMSPNDLKGLLESPSKTEVLLLDLRVSPQYAQSRIKGALNLCIPTTLLKRATFNLQKLEQTFQTDRDKGVFSAWRQAKHLVVYDAFSSEKRDAVSAMNTIKKFTNEGFSGQCSILKGGFNAFAAAYPAFINYGNTAEQKPGRPALSLPGAAASANGSKPSILPVVGGVMLPTASSSSNAFFANIRQNQDLVDGVGQMDVNVPDGTDMDALPRWLRDAASTEDHGKKVSDKFLSIEREEQSRMKLAYSYINPAAAANATEPAEQVQLCGIEKGGKNRYKDILPFEHARVKLEGKPDGACDYINASHVKASRSHKKYIASQGPLPATFEDFWSVIWDQDVRVIVMLTAESEGGQLKCHPYWKDNEFGPIKLRSLSEKKVSLLIDKHNPHTTMETGKADDSSTPAAPIDDAFGFGAAMAAAELGRRRANTTTTLEGSPQSQSQSKPKSGGGNGETPYVILRKFALSHGAHPFAPMREVTQLHYASWPDFGTPAQPSHLLALVELANVMQRSSLPAGMPGSLSTASPSRSENNSKTRLSPSPKKRSRAASNLPLAWWEEPEPEQVPHPMLVHCSAGCGRTGTFCTVDSVIDMLKRQRVRNIRKANDNIERKVRGHKPRQDPDGDVAMAGLSFDGFNQGGARGAQAPRGNPFDDAISPGTQAPKSPVFPTIGTAMAKSPSPSPSFSSDEDDDLNLLDISWIDDDTVDLIASTVHDFRCQRLSMVQTLRQFTLCYETVIEWVWRLQERGGPGGSGVGAPGTGPRGRSGTVAHVGALSK